jgi:hypothetical protein
VESTSDACYPRLQNERWVPSYWGGIL